MKIIVKLTPGELFALSIRGKLGSLTAEGEAIARFYGHCRNCTANLRHGGIHTAYCPDKSK